MCRPSFEVLGWIFKPSLRPFKFRAATAVNMVHPAVDPKRNTTTTEVDFKLKSGNAWSHNYLNQKHWHPLSYPNQKRKWIAEQKHAQNARANDTLSKEVRAASTHTYCVMSAARQDEFGMNVCMPYRSPCLVFLLPLFTGTPSQSLGMHDSKIKPPSDYRE